jgi:hypothetical protein
MGGARDGGSTHLPSKAGRTLRRSLSAQLQPTAQQQSERASHKLQQTSFHFDATKDAGRRHRAKEGKQGPATKNRASNHRTPLDLDWAVRHPIFFIRVVLLDEHPVNYTRVDSRVPHIESALE